MLEVNAMLGAYFSAVLPVRPYLSYWTPTPKRNNPQIDGLCDLINQAIDKSSSHFRTTIGMDNPCSDLSPENLHTIKARLEADIGLAFSEDPAASSHEEICATYPFVYALGIHRLAHEMYKLGHRVLARLLSEEAHSKTAIDIHPGAAILSPFFIDHGTGVVIGETASIGRNVKIYHGVTLGALSFERTEAGDVVKGTKRHPTIEDDVTLYSGCVVLGGRTIIGKGSVIGSNVWITRSIPPFTQVVFQATSLKYSRLSG